MRTGNPLMFPLGMLYATANMQLAAAQSMWGLWMYSWRPYNLENVEEEEER